MIEKGKFTSKLVKPLNFFNENLEQYVGELSDSDMWNYFLEDAPLNTHSESTRWKELYTFCQKEVDYTNQVLLEITTKG